MSELNGRGFTILRGPFAAGDLTRISEEYDRAYTRSLPSSIKIGSRSTRFPLYAGRDPFRRIYRHGPLLDVVSARIGKHFKLSSFFARTLHAHTDAPPLHQDIKSGDDGDPLIGFLFMVDPFTCENGATRFVPGSHRSAMPPVGGEEQACGPRGSMVIFDGLVWHEHGANVTDRPRRCIQGYFIRREHASARRWSEEMSAGELSSLGSGERALLAIDDL